MQVSHYVHSAMYKETYERAYSCYLLAMNERLEDRLANNKLARAKVHLIFLVKKTFRRDIKQIKVSSAFEAPNTSVYQKPCKYNELEYKITTSELCMEFYLCVMEMFCQPVDAILSIFGRGKVVCVDVVCAISTFFPNSLGQVKLKCDKCDSSGVLEILAQIDLKIILAVA